MQLDGKNGEVRWADLPPSPSTPYVPIVSPKPGLALKVLLLGDILVGVHTHWIDRRTRPCEVNSLNCEGCQLGLPRRWKGYLAAWLMATGRKCLAEVTAEAARSCPRLTQTAGGLRGWTLLLSRKGGARNGPVYVKLELPTVVGELPSDFDVRAALRRVWYGHR